MIKKKKGKYRGFVIRNFILDGITYVYGNTFETSNEEQYKNLINIKRIK